MVHMSMISDIRLVISFGLGGFCFFWVEEVRSSTEEMTREQETNSQPRLIWYDVKYSFRIFNLLTLTQIQTIRVITDSKQNKNSQN